MLGTARCGDVGSAELPSDAAPGIDGLLASFGCDDFGSAEPSVATPGIDGTLPSARCEDVASVDGLLASVCWGDADNEAGLAATARCGDVISAGVVANARCSAVGLSVVALAGWEVAGGAAIVGARGAGFRERILCSAVGARFTAGALIVELASARCWDVG